MDTASTTNNRPHRRPVFGIVALAASSSIAILIKTGLANPYPDPDLAYIVCLAVGTAGLIQLISQCGR